MLAAARAPSQPHSRVFAASAPPGDNRGSKSELVYACTQVVQDLDKCAAAVRWAATQKIVPGSLPSQ